MNKRCARCEKTVYPLEELKCLDKIWHKGCFKCQECAMTLSMKTYKGYNKLPYCEAHIPKAKATTVAETPEMRRLAENTKIQSNVQYHADFEKNKAKFTQVADDPETQRIKKNTQIISNVAYHGDLAKKEEMERKRLEPADENEERPLWHKAHGEDIVPANASVHPSKLPHMYNDDEFTYDTTIAVDKVPPQSHPVPPYSHSSRSQPPSQIYHNDHYPSPHDSSPSKGSYPPSQMPISAHPSNRSHNHQPPQRYNENPNPPPNYHAPSSPQIHNANSHSAPEYNDMSGYYPSHPAGGQNALNNRYAGKPTNGSSGSYYSTNKHGASHSNYPINSHYATGAPHRDESRRQQEQQQLKQQMQQQQQQQHQMQQQQQQQQMQKQQHHIPPQQQQHHQQYSGPPPSSQHRHPQQSSTTSFLHNQHHPQQPQQYHHHQQQQQPPQQQQAPQQQRPKQNPPTSYHHHPTQNLQHPDDANHNSPYSARTSQTLIYSSQTGPVQQPNRRVGSIADYDPVNEQYGSITQPNAGGGGYRQETTYQIQRSNLYGDQVPVQQHAPPPQMNSNSTPHHKINAPPTQLGRCYRAMYDYEAADTDEVSFKDGDLIINCTAIDEGWMTGTIQRTGITGMLPANYVERVS